MQKRLIRGSDGILPTPQFIAQLAIDIIAAKGAWLEAGLNIKGHPKAHLTFDGHLLEHVIRFQGIAIADKGEDWIERAHQLWIKLKQLTWQIPNFEKRQQCQLKMVRIRGNTELVTMTDSTNQSRKRKLTRMQNAEWGI